MLPVNTEQLRAISPVQHGQREERQHEIIEGMGNDLAAVLDKYDINSPLRIAHFMAQIAHESDGFCTTEEYASGRAYEGRRDLGNLQQGDGPLFKGRGLIQLTGRSNYRSVGSSLSLPLESRPLLVNDPHIYLLVSCEFWQQKKINSHCDADDILSVTHLVNGGLNGLDSRKAYLVKAKAVIAPLSAADVVPAGGGIPVLHIGLDNLLVSGLQRKLVALGYPVALDGHFGAATELAVKHFQISAGLFADGIVSTATWQKITERVGE